MKHFTVLLLCALICLSCLGCDISDGSSVNFYYYRNPDEYQYFEESGAIQTEARDLLGHLDDLRYMVGLYMAGPMDENLLVPFSKSTKLITAQQNGSRVYIELSDHTNALTDSEFTLACTALTLTCMDFTECSDVTITSGYRTMTLNTDNIILTDTLPQQESSGG